MLRKKAPEKSLQSGITNKTLTPPINEGLDLPPIPASEWQERHKKITDFFFSFLGTHKKRPSIRQIAAGTGYDIGAVWRHLKKMTAEDIKPGLKVAAEEILWSLASKAKSGDAAAAKLYFQIVFGWSEKATLRHEHSFDFRKIAEQGKAIDDPRERQRHLFRLLGAHNRIEQAGDEPHIGKSVNARDDVSESS